MYAGLSQRPRQILVETHDRRILRELAAKVAELAGRDIERGKIRLWYKHNSLEKTRPLVFCDPEEGWHEIIRDEDLQCLGSLARKWEFGLRKEVFWGECMKDDRVIEPFFDVPHVYSESGWGLQEQRIRSSRRGSYTWISPLKGPDDIEELRFPRITIDQENTNRLASLAHDVFGDFLTVRLKTLWWWSMGMTEELVYLRGLEQIMLDMYDNPAFVHRLMGFLRDAHMAKLDFLEENGLLSLNNDGTYVGSGGFGWTDELPGEGFDEKRVRCRDMWGFGESQETVGVSSDMFGEFIFPYQQPLLDRFGLNCYGCCEPLDNRWDVVKKTPRLRRVSVSPWSDFALMAELLEDKYIYSMKPSPTPLAAPDFDEQGIRQQLRSALEAAKGCCVEVIMKDNHTIRNEPRRVVRWCRIAREEIEKL